MTMKTISKTPKPSLEEQRQARLDQRILKAFEEEPKYEKFTRKDLEESIKDNSLNEFAEQHGGFVYHSEANGGTDHYRDGTVVSGKGTGIRTSTGRIIWFSEDPIKRLKRLSKKAKKIPEISKIPPEERKALHDQMKMIKQEVEGLSMQLTKEDSKAIDELTKRHADFEKQHGGFIMHHEGNGGTDVYADGTVVSVEFGEGTLTDWGSGVVWRNKSPVLAELFKKRE